MSKCVSLLPEQSREPRGRSPEVRPMGWCCAVPVPARPQRAVASITGKGQPGQTAVPGRRQRMPRADLTEDRLSQWLPRVCLDPCSSCGKCEAGRESRDCSEDTRPCQRGAHATLLLHSVHANNSNLALLLGSPAFLHSCPCERLETTTLHEAWLVLGIHTGAVCLAQLKTKWHPLLLSGLALTAVQTNSEPDLRWLCQRLRQDFKEE